MNKKIFYLNIGKNIKKYRNLSTNKITQEQLAERIGKSVSLISKLESNNYVESISITTLFLISRELNVPINKLVEDNDE
jgi:transcriptional regulator with XRE-family HTH domain